MTFESIAKSREPQLMNNLKREVSILVQTIDHFVEIRDSFFAVVSSVVQLYSWNLLLRLLECYPGVENSWQNIEEQGYNSL